MFVGPGKHHGKLKDKASGKGTKVRRIKIIIKFLKITQIFNENLIN